jgi:outer membrane putative beta-barrel porin/alpha-amylase
MGKGLLGTLRVVVLLGAASVVGLAQQRPLITEDVETVKPGSVRFEFGFDFQQDRDFTLSGLNGDLTRIGVVMLRMGFAPNVELEAGGVIQNFLSINRQFQPSAVPLRLSQGTNSTHDTGDFFMAAKVRLRNESRRMPSVAFRFGVELPNSNQERGIGVNQMNFFATAIAGKHFGRFNLFGNLGLGILTAPNDPYSQNDVVLYGVAGSYRVNDLLSLVGEAQGRYSTRDTTPLGTESDASARFGARIRAAGLTWDVAGQKGLYRHSARTGLTVGVTYEAGLFTPVK